MGQDSKIEWTHHTFNPWRGCTKVSDGCKHCYAEAISGRNPKSLGIWGPNGSRVIAADAYWKLPIAWNRAAQAVGERHRVFCASLADVFEGPETLPVADVYKIRSARVRLFKLIQETPHLDWLLLTKRPQFIMERVERAAYDCRPSDVCEMLNGWTKGGPPENVWLGTSVENQETGDERIPELMNCPAAVRFISCEPLLGALELGAIKDHTEGGNATIQPLRHASRPIHWVIVGGESGPGARPMHPDWARSIRDQCTAAGVAFFFKQWGEFEENRRDITGEYSEDFWLRGDGSIVGDRDSVPPGAIPMNRVGKKAAGRVLDGREWNEFPAIEPAGVTA